MPVDNVDNFLSRNFLTFGEYLSYDETEGINMSEEQALYIVNVTAKNSEVMLTAQKLKQFCTRFDKMNEEEKKSCIERVDALAPGLLVEFFNVLNEYME